MECSSRAASCSLRTLCVLLVDLVYPMLAEGSEFDVEGPGRSGFMGYVPYLRCNVARLDEEIVGRVWPHLAGPFEVDHPVDDDVGNMDALWSELTRDRFGEPPLGGFAWRKTGKIGLAAQRRRVAGGDDHAATRFDHRRRRPANEMRQGH